MTPTLPRCLLAVALATLPDACLPQSAADRTRFFLLTADTPPRGAAAGPPLGLGPVTLPDYLDRPEVVNRIAEHEVHVQGSARWAEPLREGLPRVLGQDLSRRLGAPVVPYPWDPSAAPKQAIEVEVLGFEWRNDGTAQLVATWTVRDSGTSHASASRELRLVEAVPVADGGASAAAMSRLVARLADAIARDLEQRAHL